MAWSIGMGIGEDEIILERACRVDEAGQESFVG
jgi:hypothetical protein